MLGGISSRELTEWEAFEAENGPVWLRPDWSSAQISFILANANRDLKKRPEPYPMTDFMIGGVALVEQTPEQMATIAEMAAAADRAIDERNRRIEELANSKSEPPKPESKPPPEGTVGVL